MPCLAERAGTPWRPRRRCPGSIRSRNSTTVTLAPSRRHTRPSSSPITPPPITTRCSGTAASASAPVESTTRSSSTVTPGSGAAREPVAITIALAVERLTAPSRRHLDRAGARNAGRPLSQSTLFFLNRNSTPLVSWSTDRPSAACMRARSSVRRRRRCRARRSRPCAASNISEACSSALDGMQPTLRQVPPSVSRLLDAGDRQPELGGADGGDVAARAGADDDHVVVGLADLRSRCRRGRRWGMAAAAWRWCRDEAGTSCITLSAALATAGCGR